MKQLLRTIIPTLNTISAYRFITEVSRLCKKTFFDCPMD